MKPTVVSCISGCILWSVAALAAASDPTVAFAPDEHTLLLYHFDEGQGTVAKNSSGHGYDGEVRGAQWVLGRFGKALRFDGVRDSVFRRSLPAIQGVKRLTVECWFQQDNPKGRQFLVGQDVVFHFDLSEGLAASLSLYNRGMSTTNASGLRHQQIGAGLGTVRFRKWHHLAATFDGRQVSFFLDGVLKERNPGATDFLLGVPSRGLWVGSYVGQDYWFSGRIDEVRVSDCVRYDPENRLHIGENAFSLPGKPAATKTVRRAARNGRRSVGAHVEKTLRRQRGRMGTAQAAGQARGDCGPLRLEPGRQWDRFTDGARCFGRVVRSGRLHPRPRAKRYGILRPD